MPSCPHPRDRLTLLFPASDYITGDAFEVTTCGACGLVVTSPQPSGEALERYYPPAYHGEATAKRFPALMEALQRLLYRNRAEAVERVTGAGPGRVLDIGCGRGHLLAAFRRRGWAVQGTELTEHSANYPRHVLGLPVHVGPGDALPFEPGSFDAVVMWHVLEHWPDPRVAVAEAHRLLRPGGVLMVGVPNFGSLEARLTRAGWFHLDVPRHLCHLTPASLDRILSEAGFEPRRTSFFAPEFDVFSFTQSALNLLGLRQNALYNVLRGQGAKVMAGDAGPVQAALSVVLAAPLGILSMPVTLVVGLLGQGSSLTVHAVKRH
jgi:SAM-dependent methyltransferase